MTMMIAAEASWKYGSVVSASKFCPRYMPAIATAHTTAVCESVAANPRSTACFTEPRMATMNKPCYASIKEHSPSKPVIIFVASRRQTRLTALDLISYAAGDEDEDGFLHGEVDYLLDNVKDAALKHCLQFGIGLHHAGLSSCDRDTVEQLFLSGTIQVLVATATLAWGVNLPAHLVIVKGTEFFDGKTSRYVDYPVTDVLQMMGRAGRPQFDTKGFACVLVAEGKKNFYKN